MFQKEEKLYPLFCAKAAAVAAAAADKS